MRYQQYSETYEEPVMVIEIDADHYQIEYGDGERRWSCSDQIESLELQAERMS